MMRCYSQQKYCQRLCFSMVLGGVVLAVSCCTGFKKPELSYYAPGTEAVVSELSYMKNYTRYCEPLQLPEQVALHWPIDLAVSQDGQTLYALSKEPSLFNFASDAVPESGGYRQPDLRRRYIYQLDLGKGTLDIVKHDGIPPLSCVLGTELEIDHQDRLYTVDNINEKIYRVELDRLEVLVNISEESSTALIRKSSGYYFGPPDDLKVSDNHLFYSVFAEGYVSNEGVVRRLNLNSREVNILHEDSLRHYPLSTIRGEAFSWFFPFHTALKTLVLGLTDEQRLEKMKAMGHISDVVATESQGEWIFYATDSEKHVVYRLVTSTAFEFKDFAVFAGALGQSGLKDGSRTEARFFSPSGLHLDKAGNVYVADTDNHALRKITPEGAVSTVYQASYPIK